MGIQIETIIQLLASLINSSFSFIFASYISCSFFSFSCNFCNCFIASSNACSFSLRDFNAACNFSLFGATILRFQWRIFISSIAISFISSELRIEEGTLCFRASSVSTLLNLFANAYYLRGHQNAHIRAYQVIQTKQSMLDFNKLLLHER